MVALALPRFDVTDARLTHAFNFRDFGNRHVPPGFITGHGYRRICLDHNDCCAIARFGFHQGFLQLVQSGGLQGICSQAARVGHKIHLERLAVQLAGGLGAEAVTGSESSLTQRPAEAADTGITVIVGQHDDDLDALPLRQRGETVAGYPSRKLVPTKQTSVTPRQVKV